MKNFKSMRFKILQFLAVLGLIVNSIATTYAQNHTVLLFGKDIKAIPSDAIDPSSLPKELQNFEIFQESISSNWTYNCVPLGFNHDETTEAIKAFAESTIFHGLRKLHNINPWLVARGIKERAAEKRVEFICLGMIDDLKHNTGARVFPVGRRRHIFGITISSKVEFYKMDLKIGDVASLVEDANNFSDQYHAFRHKIFHEYLHILGFDNYPVEFHSGGLSFHNRTYEHDLVYACTAHVYPNTPISSNRAINSHHQSATGVGWPNLWIWVARP